MKSRLIFLVLAGLIIAEPLRADMANTIAKVKPSVVVVGTYKNTNSCLLYTSDAADE